MDLMINSVEPGNQDQIAAEKNLFSVVGRKCCSQALQSPGSRMLPAFVRLPILVIDGKDPKIFTTIYDLHSISL